MTCTYRPLKPYSEGRFSGQLAETKLLCLSTEYSEPSRSRNFRRSPLMLGILSDYDSSKWLIEMQELVLDMFDVH